MQSLPPSANLNDPHRNLPHRSIGEQVMLDNHRRKLNHVRHAQLPPADAAVGEAFSVYPANKADVELSEYEVTLQARHQGWSHSRTSAWKKE